MKLIQTTLVASITLPAAVGCLTAPTDGSTTTGAVAMAGAATTGSAGSAGTATTGSAGTATTGSAGSATGGGSPGSAGTAGANGTTGGAAGMMGDAAGMSAGGAGAGEAGAGAGGMGTAGTGAGGMAGSGEPQPGTLITGLDGLFWAFRGMNPEDPGEGKYWLTNMDEECPADGLTRTSSVFMGTGDPTKKYTVDFELRGVLPIRCYEGGTPTAMTADAAGTKNEVFYSGGQVSGDSTLNTVQLTVDPPPDGETGTYFLNGIPSTSEMCDAQITYDVGYKAQFVIMGDSTVTLTTHSSDCKVPQNCGADPATACMPRSVDVEGVEVHASPAQPVSDFLNDKESYPQWFLIDVQAVAVVE